MGRVGGEGGGEVAGDLGPAAHHAGHLAGQDWKGKRPKARISQNPEPELVGNLSHEFGYIVRDIYTVPL